jgi:hypothetical protein
VIGKWQDFLAPLPAAWVMFAPWAVPFIAAPDLSEPELDKAAAATVVTSAAAWNHYVVGALLLAISISAVFAFRPWKQWVRGVLGLWLAVSPWIVGFSNVPPLTLDAVVIGLIIVALSASALYVPQRVLVTIPPSR